jgi:hypothetical protein
MGFPGPIGDAVLPKQHGRDFAIAVPASVAIKRAKRERQPLTSLDRKTDGPRPERLLSYREPKATGGLGAYVEIRIKG